MNMKMNMKAQTKIALNGGSLRTTVPKKIADILEIKEGDKICWILRITEKGPILEVSPIKK